MKTLKPGIYRIAKFYRGGGEIYNLIVNQDIIERFGTWDELYEYIGENTNGGFEAGYRIYSRKIASPLKKCKTITFGYRTSWGMSIVPSRTGKK